MMYKRRPSYDWIVFDIYFLSVANVAYGLWRKCSPAAMGHVNRIFFIFYCFFRMVKEIFDGCLPFLQIIIQTFDHLVQMGT